MYKKLNEKNNEKKKNLIDVLLMVRCLCVIRMYSYNIFSLLRCVNGTYN